MLNQPDNLMNRCRKIRHSRAIDFNRAINRSRTAIPRNTSWRAGAILSMELVLVLPIFLLLVMSVVEFSMLMSARSRVSDAARYGARLISMSGSTTGKTEQIIQELLGPRLSRNSRIKITESEEFPGVAVVSISIPMKNAAPDLLWMIGFSVSDRLITSDAAMVAERSLAVSDGGFSPTGQDIGISTLN